MNDYIDLLKLYALGNENKWNKFLAICLVNKDINKLAQIRNQLQRGMNELVKKKLNDEKMNLFFIRLQKSLDDTAKNIIKSRNPMPGDNPLGNKELHKTTHDIKKQRDKELLEYLRRCAY